MENAPKSPLDNVWYISYRVGPPPPPPTRWQMFKGAMRCLRVLIFNR